PGAAQPFLAQVGDDIAQQRGVEAPAAIGGQRSTIPYVSLARGQVEAHAELADHLHIDCHPAIAGDGAIDQGDVTAPSTGEALQERGRTGKVYSLGERSGGLRSGPLE